MDIVLMFGLAYKFPTRAQGYHYLLFNLGTLY